MLTRRSFLRAATASALVPAFRRLSVAQSSDHNIGVQLYTVRSLIEKDAPATLKAIRALGYRSVETYAAQYKIGAGELRQQIADAGLSVPSMHFGYNDFESKFEYAREVGTECVVCGMMPLSIANSADGYKRGAEQYNKWGEQARKMNLRFGFHNHNVEFQTFGGHTGLEILMENTDPALVGWQMDCYWVAQAGLDPVEMLHKYGKRIQSLHLKDRKPNVSTSVTLDPGSAHFTEVGEGTLDWKSILSLAKQRHVPYMFVEEDQTERPPLQSLKISYDHIVQFMDSIR